MVVPTLNEREPILFIPVAGELAVVAPVNVHVWLTTPQLSPVVGLGVATVAEQRPAALLAVILAGHTMVGAGYQ